MTPARPAGRPRLLGAALALLALGAGCAPPGPSVSAARHTARRAAHPVATACGRRPAGTVHYRHVVWIWMENHGYSDIIGAPGAPFLNDLARICGVATRYYSLVHPSLPNYLTATGGSSFGVRDDADPSAHRIAGPSIFGQLQAHGLTWRSYVESMPRPCDQVSAGQYAAKHNPAAYYVAIRARCRSWDVPLGTGRSGALVTALRSGTLPAFSFITPNLCDDMHNCAVTAGDSWLAHWIPRFVASPAYPSTAIFIVWDEDGSAQRVPCLVVAPGTARGARASVRTSHLGLLHTTELLLGLPPLNARVAAAHPIVALTGAAPPG